MAMELAVNNEVWVYFTLDGVRVHARARVRHSSGLRGALLRVARFFLARDDDARVVDDLRRPRSPVLARGRAAAFRLGCASNR